MSKWKIEIWQCHRVIATYESDKIDEILKWYMEEWSTVNEFGGCTFEVYEYDKRLTFEEKYALGFYK